LSSIITPFQYAVIGEQYSSVAAVGFPCAPGTLKSSTRQTAAGGIHAE
jgi:hypothetical protein